MDINFELYKVFYHVAKHLSFTEAAAKLFISQSAVSQSVKQLEEQLGATLFVRNTKQVKLTPDGDMLYKHVEQAFNFIKTGERAVQEVHSLQRGEIRIGASDTICRRFLLPYLQQFNRLYPQVKINITNRPSPVCIELLKKGQVDISVAHLGQIDKYKHMTVDTLKTVHDVFVTGKAAKHLHNAILTPDQLSHYPLLMLEQHTITRTFFDEFVRQNNMELTPEIELGSIDLLIDLVKIGLGISFMSREYIEEELASGELFILNTTAEIPPRYIGLITHNRLPVPIAAQKFIELLKQ